MSGGRTLVEARKNLIACNRLAKHPMTFNPRELSSLIGSAERDRPKTYFLLGKFARAAFIANPPVTLTDGVTNASESGFDSLARLLSFSPAAYLRFCRPLGVKATAAGLGEALKSDWEAPQRFMRLPSDDNQRLEEEVGLKSYASGMDSEHFRFEATPKRPRYKLDDAYFAEQTKGLQYVAGIPEYWQRCLGERLILERIWPAMVDLAVATPEVFARDLQMAATI